MSKITVDAKMESLSEVSEFVESTLNDQGCSMKNSMKFLIAVDEIFNNIASYSGASKVDITVENTNDEITLIFSDDGTLFNPLLKEDPDVTLSASERGIGGLGLLMVKKSMDSVVYENKDGLNVLTLKKAIDKPSTL